MADGKFNLTQTGFSFHSNNTPREVNWNEIEEIIAYKKDLVTTDLVCIDLILEKTIITLHEEMPDWESIIEKLLVAFPTIEPDWEWRIIQPPFATNETVIYKKKL